MSNKMDTRSVIVTGMFAAVLAVMSQISVPLPSGVPVTLQTFAIALTGVVLGHRLGTAATAVYIVLGAVGVPVFSNFSGGLECIVGKTGGFIWGFLFLVLFTGIGAQLKNRAAGIAAGMAGLVICHLLGVAQFAFLMKMEFVPSLLMVSAPYLIKDILSVVLAYGLGFQIRRRVMKSGC